MMIFTSIYGVADGFFVSNYVRKTSFAAVNFIMPVIMILGGFGFMIGTGGSSLVAKTLGEKDTENANRYFTMMIKLTVVLGIVLSAVGIVFMRTAAYLRFRRDLVGNDNCRVFRVYSFSNICFCKEEKISLYVSEIIALLT